MKTAECAHPSKYFSASASAKIPTFFYILAASGRYWGTRFCIQFCQKQDAKQDAKLKFVILSDIRIP